MPELNTSDSGALVIASVLVTPPGTEVDEWGGAVVVPPGPVVGGVEVPGVVFEGGVDPEDPGEGTVVNELLPPVCDPVVLEVPDDSVEEAAGDIVSSEPPFPLPQLTVATLANAATTRNDEMRFG